MTTTMARIFTAGKHPLWHIGRRQPARIYVAAAGFFGLNYFSDIRWIDTGSS